MKQIDKMTKDDWKDMGKVTKDLQRATIRWKNSVVGNFGKSHPSSKKAMTLLKQVMKLKSELDDLKTTHRYRPFKTAEDCCKSNSFSKIYHIQAVQ